MRRLAVLISVVATATAAFGVTAASAASAGMSDPPANVAPSPDFWPTCSSSGVTSQACDDAVLTAINNARAAEGVGPMVLPADFASLTTAQQTFVVSNLERVDRGLTPAAGMVDSLNSLSASAAGNDADPMLTSWTVGPFDANRWGSIWAGDLNALAADYDWMYDDGWGPTGSFNVDCQSATDGGCWGHRHNILMSTDGELITGVGSVVQSQWTSIAQIFVAGSGTYPPFTLAWSDVTSASGTTAGPPATTPTTAPPPVGAAPSAVTVSAPSWVPAGQAARFVGRLSNATTRAPLAGRNVSVCHRAAAATAATCAPATTDSTGTVSVLTHPTMTTSWWLVFAGTSTAQPVTSHALAVQVRPVVHMYAAHTSRGWTINAHMTPARGQSVWLQRHTSSGWVTVRRVVAQPSMWFGSLPSGTFRLVVSAVRGSLGTTAQIRAA
jgi:hypothetical protein